jgi:predicted ATPase
MTNTNPWYVLTGGPCAGKTTLVKEFEADGIRVVHESARAVIERGLASGQSLEEIRKGPTFVQDIIALDTANLSLHTGAERVFFDRSIIDNIAYHRIFGAAIPPELEAIARDAPFRKVFLLDLLEYQTDEARNETPEEARAIHDALQRAYIDFGIPVVRVPVLPIAERVEFVLANL